MSGAGRALATTAAILAALALLLHLPVVTRGALITPAGMHHAMWPWKGAPDVRAPGMLLEENHTLSDLLFQVYPWQLQTTRSLEAGTVPLWNPYSYCGAPFVANAQSAVFYPLHWPAWIFPSMRIFTIALLAKIVLAGLFMAIFLRGLGLSAAPCVLGAVSFALGGFMTSWLGYAHTNAAVMLPLLMHAARVLARAPGAGGALLLAFAGAAQYLGGHPETSLHIMGASLLYFLWELPRSPRRGASAGFFAAGGLLGFLMAAVQLFPFTEYLLKSAALRQRLALPGVDPTLPADAAMTLLVPGLFGRPWNFTYNGPAAWQAVAGYAGAGVLLLAIVGIRWMRGVRFFWLLAAVSAVVVYGPPEVRSVLRVIPLVGITSNNRLHLLLGFCIAALAANAAHRLALGVEADYPRERRSTLALIAATGLLLCALTLGFSARDPAGARDAWLIVGGTAAMAAGTLLRASRRSLYVAGLAAITCVDLFVFAYGYNPHADPEALFPATPLTDFLRRDAASDMARGGRLVTIGWVMRPETHMIYRLHSIEGYDALELDRYRRLLDRAGVDGIHATGDVPAEARPLLNLAGVRYLVAPPGGVVSGAAMRLVYDGLDGRVFLNEDALPRFRFVERAVIAEESEALDLAASGRVDPRRAVILEDTAAPLPAAPPLPPGPETPASPLITLERNMAGALTVGILGAPDPGYLVIADAWDEGWRARVNGRPEPVLLADAAFRAVAVPAGEATVTLEYRPFWYRAGAWISILALLASVAIALVRWGSVTT